MNLIDYINLAEREAFKRHIRTNSVMINKELLLIDEGRIATNQYYSHIPPMICGLWAFVTDELPEEIIEAYRRCGIKDIRIVRKKVHKHHLMFVK